MDDSLTCPQGHHWRSQANGEPGETIRRHACPVCGEAALTLDAPPLTENTQASTVPILAGSPERPAIPGYEIQGELGRGGMGIVYRAWQNSLKRTVALKMIRGGLHAAVEDVERFRNEAEAVGRLQHPNIVQIHEVGEWRAGDGVARPFFSLEYVDGGSLALRIADFRLPIVDWKRGTDESGNAWSRAQIENRQSKIVDLLETLARAVHAAHQRGIIHRDLKPANVLLTLGGTPKIADFGLAKQLDDDASRTRSGAILGTPSYMAPEQAAGKVKEITTATDVYALGAILYELVTGRPPFRAETMLETLERVRSQEPISPSRLQPRLPRDLVTICLKCLQKEPRQRYGSAEALAEDLRRFRNGESILARPVGSLERAYRWCRRNPAAVAVMAVLFISVLVVTVTSLWSYRAVREQLHESLHQQARALWLGGESGWRQQSLDAIKKAAAIRKDERLRGSAIQALVGWDAHVEAELPFGHNFETSLAIRPDGQELTAAVGSKLHVWSFQSGTGRIARELGPAVTMGLKYSPDGSLLARASGDSVFLSDVRTDRVLHQLGPHEGQVRAMTFGPGPNALVSVDGGHIYVWDLRTGKAFCRESLPRRALKPEGAPPEEIKAKPKLDAPEGGAKKPTTSRPDSILRYGLVLALVGQVEAAPMPGDRPREDSTPAQIDVIASVRRRFVVVARSDGLVLLWRFADGRLLESEHLPLQAGPNVRLALSGDERRLFLASNERSDMAPVPRAGERGLEEPLARPKPAPAEEIKAKPKTENPEAHLPLGSNWLSSVTLLLGFPQQPGAKPAQPVQPVDTTPNTALAAPTAGVTLPQGLFGPTGGAAAQEVSATQQPAAQTPGANVVSGVESVTRATIDSGLLGRWGPQEEVSVWACDIERKHLSFTAVRLGSLRALAIGEGDVIWLAGDSGLIGQCRFGGQGIEVERIFGAGAGELRDAAFSPQGRRFIVSAAGRPIRAWRIDGGDFSDTEQPSVGDWCEIDLPAHGPVIGLARWNQGIEISGAKGQGGTHVPHAGVTRLAVTKSGKQVVYNSRQRGREGLFSAARSIKEPFEIQMPAQPVLPTKEAPGFRILTLALSPDERHLALAGTNPAVVIRNFADPKLPHEASLGPNDALVWAISFSNDGRLLAGAASDGTVYVWRTSDWSPLGTFEKPGVSISTLAFSPDGRLLAGGFYEGGPLMLWHVEDGSEVASSAAGPTSSLAFSSDGLTLAVGGQGGRIRLFDVAKRKWLAQWKGHQNDVIRLVWSPGDDTLRSCARNGEICRWHLDRIRAGLRDIGLDW